MRPLLTVEEALALVLEHVPASPGTEEVALGDAGGRVLGEDVVADRDYPSFPRSRVDGYAVRAGDVSEPGRTLHVVMEVPAGAPPPRPLAGGEAARIFTGAEVPEGADAVVMQEDCAREGETVRVDVAPKAGQHVVPTGHERPEGERVATLGDVVSPGLVAVLASVGAVRPTVAIRPRVRVVATGDEIVPIESDPPPGRIRNSNAPALAALVASFGAAPDGQYHAVDMRASLDAELEDALDADVCVLAGGVSVGVYDLVPAALADAGVECVLHGVRMQPGKPLWFGTRGRTLVFGLPGNPVSAMVTATLFVRPAVRRLLGLSATAPGPRSAVLGGPLRAGSWRRRYDPVRLENGPDDELVATPVPYRGSGDVFGFAAADALAIVPEDSPAPAPGDRVQMVPLSTWRG